MKIALTVDSFIEGQGGVSTAVAALARILRQRGHQVIVYSAADPSHSHSDLDVIGLWALRYARFPGGRIPIDPAKLTRELIRFHPDIIHNHSMSVMGMQALAAARLLGIPILGTCHVYLAGFLNYAPISLDGQPMMEKVAWQYTANLYNHFPNVTTPSEAMRLKLASAGLHVPSAAVSNGVDTNLFHPHRPLFRLTPQTLTILHVGRLGYEKSVDVVLRAFGHLAHAYPQARLVIVGDGPQTSQLQSLAKDLEIASRVEFVGQVCHDRLPDIYRQANVFVTASTIETQGLVVLEAMASGLPIVGVDALALPELIQPGVNGYLAPPEDEHALAEAMAQLLRSEDLRLEMGNASRQITLQHSLPRVAEQYEAIYLRLCEKFFPAWFSFPKMALAWQGAGFNRNLNSMRTLDQSARKVFAPIFKWMQNRLPGRRE
jgi:glycosyltransferase involved in cell wall biosynthesis